LFVPKVNHLIVESVVNFDQTTGKNQFKINAIIFQKQAESRALTGSL